MKWYISETRSPQRDLKCTRFKILSITIYVKIKVIFLQYLSVFHSCLLHSFVLNSSLFAFISRNLETNLYRHVQHKEFSFLLLISISRTKVKIHKKRESIFLIGRDRTRVNLSVFANLAARMYMYVFRVGVGARHSLRMQSWTL